MPHKQPLFVFLFLLASVFPARGQSEKKAFFKKTTGPAPFKVEILADFRGIPWGMVFINDTELLFTEKQGQLSKLHIPTGKISSIFGAPEVIFKHQGGLLDVTLHPDFKKNRKVYFSYSLKGKKKKGHKTTAVAKGFLKKNRIVNLKNIFIAKPFKSGNRHFGSRLIFDEKGFLFVTMGDRGDKKEAQNLNSHLGKILRLTDKGKAPKDNPFANTKGAQPEIWSFGHRNPQGLFLHPKTKELWALEHGPKGGDELNLIKKGQNYGWPVITHGKSYAGFKIGEGTHKKGMRQPVKYWTPSISPCGLLIYSGKKFPHWKGHFFLGALSGQHLNRLKVLKEKVIEEERLLSSLSLRFRHVIEGPKGFIYVATDQGQILKLTPVSKR